MLNPEQKKAVETTKGRVLVLAGAGSGKTSVITHRIAHLINDLHVSPTKILGLTFTNKAAEEMRRRLGSLLNPSVAKKVTLCTFHSFCMQVLRKDISHLGYTKEFSLYDEKDVKRLVTQLVRHMLQHEGELPSMQLTLESLKNTSHQEPPTQFIKDLSDRLKICMRAYNAVDFDSLLSLTLQLFQQHPAALEVYQERYHYIMIDEYQDTNSTQYELAQLLSQKYNNLCVVGDDDQSIYGWRGAEIKNILSFSADTRIKLQQNYRSTPNILHAANALIGNNRERHEKELWSALKEGEPLTIFHAPTEAEEAQGVIQRMVSFHRDYKIPWKEMAILYRSNILSRPFEMALMQAAFQKDGNWVRGIPYQIFGGTEFYERSEIKDITAYLRAIINPLDQEALLRIINVPRRGISDQALDKLTQINRSKNIPLWDVLKQASCADGLSDRALNGVKSFVTLMETAREKFSSSPCSPTLKWLIEVINYKKAIEEEVKSDKMRLFKEENVTAFIENLAEWEKTSEGELADFVGTLTLDEASWFPDNPKASENKVNLMTFHSAKGLEFSVCFLVGLEDHIIPHEKSLQEGSLEEERRLMYVAMTRAKEHLLLSMARQRKRYGKDENSNPSRFLFEIPKNLVKIAGWNDVY
jgi:superfamily I DNA/RNA helicase